MRKINAERVFLIVLDSLGIGELPDAKSFGDEGSNTLKACFDSGELRVPNMERLGLFNIDGCEYGEACAAPAGAYGRLAQASAGKDTTVGHWEICGLITEKRFPTYPDGFPPEIIDSLERATGRRVLCNKPYSGTQAIRDYGRQQLETGALIVYTSADSVLQIAAHEDVVGVEELYDYCRAAREILSGENAVARVIARPFSGEYPFVRTAGRHDFSLAPPKPTLLDFLRDEGLALIPIGKIYDIFAGRALEQAIPTGGNADGMRLTSLWQGKDFNGLCFTNLVDFDMTYGHRNDIPGYTAALNEFDRWLGGFIDGMRSGDILMITADHGCDPSTPSTDHSREYVPLLVYGRGIRSVNLGTRKTYADIGKTVAALFEVEAEISGASFEDEITEG